MKYINNIEEGTDSKQDLSFLLEGVMSDLHLLAKEVKTEDEFIKKFFKEHGDKVKKTPDSIEWVKSLYKDTIGESVTEGKEYKIGDKYKKDFDYYGMLAIGKMAKITMPIKKLQQLFNSFESVNYHREGSNLSMAIDELKDKNKKDAKFYMDLFNQACEDTLEDMEERMSDAKESVTEGKKEDKLIRAAEANLTKVLADLKANLTKFKNAQTPEEKEKYKTEAGRLTKLRKAAQADLDSAIVNLHKDAELDIKENKMEHIKSFDLITEAEELCNVIDKETKELITDTPIRKSVALKLAAKKKGWVIQKYNESVTEAEKYDTKEFKVGDKIKTNIGVWEVIETDYKPGKSFAAPFIFKGKDMKRLNIPNPPKTNKNAVGYKVTDGDKYPIIGFLYQYKDITKLATVGVDESVTEGKMYKVKELSNLWYGVYGEPLSYYDSFLNDIERNYRRGISKDEIVNLWDKHYGEDMEQDYSGFYDQLEESVNEMKMVNKKTGKDITKHVLDLMMKKISQKEFEKLTGLKKDELKVNESIMYQWLITEGQFSWLTQDRGEQIGSERQNTIDVWMFDNKGNKWMEKRYEGYGEFGGMDYYDLLAAMNGYKADRQIGIDLAFNKIKTKDKGRKTLFPALVGNPRFNWKQHDFTKEAESDPNQSWYQEDEFGDEYGW